MSDAVLERDPVAAELPFRLSAEWLTSREFVFRVGSTVATRALRFQPDGRITGYGHPNEALWSTDGDALMIMSESREVTCKLAPSGEPGPAVTLSGPYIGPLPAGAGRNVHYVEEKQASLKPPVATFDLFDTLIARRGYAPVSVFQQVEDKSGVADFVRLRQLAEGKLLGRQLYGLADIYNTLQQETGWDDGRISMLKTLELEEEWASIFPIAEMTALVQPEDIIVSDMYLPHDFVQRLVEDKCGLAGRRLIVSNYGKYLGVIWPKLLEGVDITRHYGDNAFTDVESPRRFGIPTRHVLTSHWTRGEQVLGDQGLGEYAEAIREARLSTKADAEVRGAIACQFEINLPLLLIGSSYVMQQARRVDADRILMCGRDCNLWEPLLRIMLRQTPAAASTRYLLASRRLFNAATPDYQAYFFGQLGKSNLLVDLSGTGRSLAKFLNLTGARERVKPILLACDPKFAAEGHNVDTLIDMPALVCRLALEALNTSVDGSAACARTDPFRVVIEPAKNDLTAELRSLIEAMHVAATQLARVMEQRQARVDERLPEEELRKIGSNLIALLPEHWENISPLVAQQAAELIQE